MQLRRQEQSKESDVFSPVPVHSGVLQDRIGLRLARISAVITYQEILDSYASAEFVSADKEIVRHTYGNVLIRIPVHQLNGDTGAIEADGFYQFGKHRLLQAAVRRSQIIVGGTQPRQQGRSHGGDPQALFKVGLVFSQQ